VAEEASSNHMGVYDKIMEMRNEERHDWDKESQDSSHRKVLHKELEEIYD
jgi:hypothetical protein